MAEAVRADKPKRTITRKRAGFKRVVVELTDRHYEQLAKLSVEDIRRGGPTEMLSVLCRLNLDALIKAHRPAQMFLMGTAPTPLTYPAVGEMKGDSVLLQMAEEVPGLKSRERE